MDCNTNFLTSLDLSGNTGIYALVCNNNLLSSLTIKNGQNNSIVYLFAITNPDLLCIEVDSINYMNSISVYIDTFTVFSTNCSGIEPIKGNVYNDINSNCTYDSGDLPLGNVHLKLYNNSNLLVHQVFTKASGFYQFNVPSGMYKVVLDTIAKPYTVQCIQPGIDTTLFTSFSDTTNFDVVCKPGFDLSVHSITNAGNVFPGQQHQLKIIAGDASRWNNLDCATGVGGEVVLTIGGPVTYLGPVAGAMVPVTSGNTLTYSISDFGTINNSTDFGIILSTDTSAFAGDSVCVTATILSTSGAETNISNNSLHICYLVRNSFDPNNKETYPTDVRPSYSDFFTYKVSFQNTGTAPAFTIKVVDTLAANLDLNTFELMSYSHPCSVSIDGNIIRADFENINLIDSAANEAASHGYFQYRIKPKQNQPFGAQIENTAYIYFDFNPAVATNTTVNLFSVVTSLTDIQDNITTIYPNPSAGIFNVSSSIRKEGRVKIFNVLGELVYQSQLQKNKPTVIDLSQQSKGVYVLRIEEDGKGFLNKKIVIQ
ncbi:MAG TPA: T9SS type A sorting domain-containing protein [Bacteroidia bacterium]|nr:T9SS type A sorting domain-containing protein [Bacteroidia bacterium]